MAGIDVPFTGDVMGTMAKIVCQLGKKFCEVLKPGFRGVLEIYQRSEIYVLYFTQGKRLRYIVISYMFRFIYVKKKRDEFGYKRGDPGSWTKKLYGWLTWSVLDILNSLVRL